MDNFTMARRQNPEIREFILQNVEAHPDAAVSMAAKNFGISRAAIAGYVSKLLAEGLITAEGKTRARRYALKPLVKETFRRERNGLWTEDDVWREQIAPLMKGVKQNIVDLFHYGCTEMINNVLDHSQSPDLLVRYTQNYTTIQVSIVDQGIGIFNKIQNDFRLADARTALLELSKGKLTSDKKRHSGEGVYFTSRMFDRFSILSGYLCYSRIRREGEGWLIESTDEQYEQKGTGVIMRINTNAYWTPRDVFDKYQGDDVYFRKTHIPVTLGKYPGEQLVSRSQAKRILARCADFSEIILDFTDVAEIGQPFADEIFRVFKNEHPDTPILAVCTNENVERVIKYVQSGHATLPLPLPGPVENSSETKV